MRRADWLVDVGPDAGERGGRVLYSGPPAGLRGVAESHTARYLFARTSPSAARRAPQGWLELRGITRNNLRDLDARFPLGVMTAVVGVSGSGKSSLVSQALVELVCRHLGHEPRRGRRARRRRADRRRGDARPHRRGHGAHRPAGARRPEADRPHAALQPRHLHRPLRRGAAALRRRRRWRARARYDPGRFSFNVAKGRCETCEGEGFVSVELHFMPSVYAPCPACHGARYNAKTLEVRWNGRNIAEVLR
jgi:excinuclease ABC subunit A